MANWIGKQIGKYEITGLLGRGGMGEVYKAHHSALERDVAVKLIHTHLAGDPGAVDRFRREAKVVAALRHVGIVQIFDFDVEGDAFYMVMEFVPGQSLKERLVSLHAQNNRLSLPEALQLFRSITEAVAYAHNQGVVHRDLKPANVLLTTAGQPILADFGLSRLISSEQLTAAGDIFGTPHYMSPEQSRGQTSDTRTDVYALGIMLYELTTGILPFTGDTPVGIILKQISEPAPPPRSINPDLPEAVEQVIQQAIAKDPAARYPSAQELLQAVEDLILPQADEQTILAHADDGRCPYRGLQSFEAEHAEFFFGREALIDQLVGQIVALSQPGESRFLAVLGASGSGKSSLVRAGLIPALQGGAIPGGKEWPILVLKPGSRPLEELAAQLAPVLYSEGERLTSTRQLLDNLIADGRALHLAVRLAWPELPPERRLLLVVDQFEEIFTLCHDETERHRFIENLLYAAGSQGQVMVLLTMRADFYHRCAAYRDLAGRVSSQQVLVGPMDEAELRRAIERPAGVVGLRFEPGLADTILADVAQQPGALPLLQHALLELWERRQRGLLTLQAYQDSGGVTGAIAQRAETLYADFNPEEQAIVRRVMLRLTQPGEGTEDTRRRARMSEFVSQTSEVFKTSEVSRVIQQLTNARLLTTTRDAASGEEMVDVAHEALIRGWGRLREWIDEDRAALRTHRRLTEVAEEWERNERDESYLYRGARLAEADEWAEAHAGNLNALEREFLEASLTTARAIERARETARRRRNLLVLGLGIVAITIACFMTGLTGLAVRFAFVSEARAIAAQARSVLDDNPPLAVRLALTAQNIANTDEAERVIADALFIYPPLPVATIVGHSIPVHFLKWSPDGSRLISGGGSSDRNYQPTFEYGGWNFTDNQPIGFPQGRRGFAVHPDGSKIALASPGSREIFIWNTTKDQLETTLKGHKSHVTNGIWSPDGKLVAAGLWNGQVALWDVTSGRQVRTFEEHDDWIIAVAFSPDSKRLAAKSVDGVITIWDIGTGQIINTHTGKPYIGSLSWSPDGTWLTDQPIYVGGTTWNVNTGQEFITPENFTLVGNRDTWSPSEKQVLLWSTSKQATVVWDMIKDQIASELLSGVHPVRAIWSPDGTRLGLIPSGGAEITVWDIEKDEAIVTLENNLSDVSTISWSPDGIVLASGHADGRVVVWDVNDNQVISNFLGHSGKITILSWSPDGKKLASGSEDNTVQVWNLTRNRPPVIEFEGATGEAGSPDGAYMALRTDEDSVLLWDVKQSKSMATVESQSKIIFSPDGTLLAARPRDNTITIWDVHQGKKLSTLAGHDDEVTVLVWTPDSTLLASGGADDQLIIWEPLEEQVVAQISEHTDSITALAWSSDGRQLASGSKDKTVFVWNAVNRQLSGPFLGHVSEISHLSWNSDGTRLHSLSSSDKVDFVWDVASGQPVITAGGLRSRFTDEGSHLVSNKYGGTGTIVVLDPVSGRLVATIPGNGILAWSPNGTHIATNLNNRSVILWDLVNNRPIGTLEDVPSVVAWHPNETHLAYRSQRNLIKILDVERGEIIQTLEDHRDEIEEIIWSPNGERLASKTINNEVKLWNVDTPRPLITKNELLDIVWSPDGARLVSSTVDNALLLWGAEGEEMTLTGHLEPVTALAWSPDGKWVASGSQDKSVILWNAVTGEKMATFDNYEDLISGLSWGPESNQLAIGFDDGTIIVWDVHRDESILTLEKAYNQSTDMAWSQDGKYLISHISGKVTVWEIATGQPFKIFPGILQNYGNAVYNSPSSLLALDSGEKLAVVWDAATGEPSLPIWHNLYLKRPELEQAVLLTGDRMLLWDLKKNKAVAELEGSTDNIVRGLWSTDGKYLAGVSRDGRVTIWDVNQEQVLATFKEHSDQGFDLRWSPKKNLLALESQTGKIVIRDVEKDEIMATYPEYGTDVSDLTWSPDGTQLAWIDSDNSFVVWHPGSGEFSNIAREGISGLSWIADGTQLLLTWEQPDSEGIVIFDKQFAQPPCRWISRNLSFQEWQQYIPFYLLPYRNACPGKPLPSFNLVGESIKSMAESDLGERLRLEILKIISNWSG